jgi:hypothetical protein
MAIDAAALQKYLVEVEISVRGRTLFASSRHLLSTS